MRIAREKLFWHLSEELNLNPAKNQTNCFSVTKSFIDNHVKDLYLAMHNKRDVFRQTRIGWPLNDRPHKTRPQAHAVPSFCPSDG
jgi:hypothetical protein